MVRVRSQHARGGAAARRLRLRARRFLGALGLTRAELSILIVGDAGMRRINREWRGVDQPTDVLSFPAARPGLPGAPGPGAPKGGARPAHPVLLGDVVISLDTARRRARAEGRPPGAELDRYLAHGLLHLLGFDHRRPREAREMAVREETLLAGEGMVAAALGSPEGSRSGSRSG